MRFTQSRLFREKMFLGFATLLACIVVGNLNAQPAERVSSPLRGEVESTGSLPANLRIEVHGARGIRHAIAPVFADGGFELSGLPLGRGSYEVRVVSARGQVLLRETHWLPNGSQPLVLRLKEEKPSARPSEQTISLERLKRAPSRKAAREYEQAHRAAQDGDDEQAVQHFRRALTIHPEYIEALNDLGVRLTRMGRYSEAIEAFEKACELDPTGVKPRTNLALVLLENGQAAKSEQVARRAVELAGNNEQARYLLGMAMLRREGAAGAAVEELIKAAPQFPRARLIAAEALIGLGRAGEAQAQLRSFLQQGEAPKP